MSKGTILVVEPDDEYANFLKIYLEREGYLVFKTINASEVLSYIESEIPDVILMADCNQCDIAQQAAWRKRIPILELVSAKTNLQERMIQTGDFQIFDYLVKPIEIEEILVRLPNAFRYSHKNPQNPASVW